MKSLLTSLTLAALLSPLAAHAQFAKPEDAIKYRQSAFSVMGTHFGRLGAMVNGRIPYDAKVATDNANIVAMMSRLPGAGFGPGTDTGMNTRAKAEIWRDGAKFQAAYDKFLTEAAKLPAAAGDAGTLKTAFGATAATCKGCHDDFRRD